MFIPAQPPETEAEQGPESGLSSHCWCNCTLTETGPDDRPVGPKTCVPSRSCFKE
jgi:hypothetical protein